MISDETRDSFPSWWGRVSSPPPASWSYMYEQFTGEDTGDEWALAAAIFVARARKRTSEGPTFSELFAHLMPDTNGGPGPLPAGIALEERRSARSRFRFFTALAWRQRRMITWSRGVERSLRVDRRFTALSRDRRRRIVQELNDALGQTLVSVLCGTASASATVEPAIGSWSTLRAQDWTRLEFAHATWNLVDAIEGRDVARRWFIGSNARLGGDTPVMAIRKGRHSDVQTAAESLIRDDVDE